MAEALKDSAHWQQRRQDWIIRVAALVAEIAQWARAEGWTFEQQTKVLREKNIGEYEVPSLVIHLQGGEIEVNPIALHTIGANGRVDIEAFPTLSRVKLLGVPDGWMIMTDSNVPLREPWTRETFSQLAHALLS